MLLKITTKPYEICKCRFSIWSCKISVCTGLMCLLLCETFFYFSAKKIIPSLSFCLIAIISVGIGKYLCSLSEKKLSIHLGDAECKYAHKCGLLRTLSATGENI